MYGQTDPDRQEEITHQDISHKVTSFSGLRVTLIFFTSERGRSGSSTVRLLALNSPRLLLNRPPLWARCASAAPPPLTGASKCPNGSGVSGPAVLRTITSRIPRRICDGNDWQ